MADYGPSSTGGLPSSIAQRSAMMSYIAGGLGVLSFIWGFLTWYTEGDGGDKTNYGGYAFIVNAAAIIGFSLAAGLLALAATVERRGPSLTPAVLATVSFLLVIGALIGKGDVDGGGGNGPKTGVGVGLILELITVIVQVAALVFGWMAATGRVTSNRPPAWQQGQQGQGYAQQMYGAPSGYGQTQQMPGYPPAPQPQAPRQPAPQQQPHPPQQQPHPAQQQPHPPQQQPQAPQQPHSPQQPQSPPPGYGAPPAGPGYQPPTGH